MGLMAIGINRREAILFVTSLSAVACASKEPIQPPVQATRQSNENLNRVHQEVRRLALMYSVDSLVRKVYLGNVAEISPIFVAPLPVGFVSPETYATTIFGQAEYTPNKRFRYSLTRDRSVVDYATLRKQVVSIVFSEKWLSTTRDQVKVLALEKEALQLGLWEPFSQIALNTYLSQGRVEKIDPTTSDQEIARTFARNLLIENAQVRKLYDYAGYLAVLPKVGQLLASQDPQIIAELNYSNMPQVYNLAKKNEVQFEGIAVNSTDFLSLAFDPNSNWAAMISSSSLPAPAAPRN